VKIKNPLAVNQERLYPIQSVLKDLAAQENCDGEPYDQMQLAAEYINGLELLLKELQNLLISWQKKTPSYAEIEKRDKLLEKMNALLT